MVKWHERFTWWRHKAPLKIFAPGPTHCLGGPGRWRHVDYTVIFWEKYILYFQNTHKLIQFQDIKISYNQVSNNTYVSYVYKSNFLQFS